jgi:hypothetical protein
MARRKWRMAGCSLSRFSTCVTLARVSPWRRARPDWFTPPASSCRRNSSARASVFWIGEGCHTFSRDFSPFLVSWKSITTSVTILPLQAPLGSHSWPSRGPPESAPPAGGRRDLTARLLLSRISSLEGDAAKLAGYIPIGSVFFLYCPFGGERLARVLGDLEHIARTRELRVCCIDLPLPPSSWLTLDPPSQVISRSTGAPSSTGPSAAERRAIERAMADFPSFMKNPANRIANSSQHTSGVDGYVFDGADGTLSAGGALSGLTWASARTGDLARPGPEGGSRLQSLSSRLRRRGSSTGGTTWTLSPHGLR